MREREMASTPTWRKWALALSVFLVMLTTALSASATPAPWAEGGASRPEDIQVELVTFGPGDEVVSWFGHTAIAVRDSRLNIERLYNYGMFSFDETVAVKYAMGRLEFWVAPTPYARTLQLYAREGRFVRVLPITLPPEKRMQIAHFLEDNIRPENRDYLYHHYDDNCATRIRDIFDLATDGKFGEYARNTPARMTLRGHTRRHATQALLDYGMMYAMGGKIDQPITVWDEMFLPVELEEQVKKFTYTNAAGETVSLAGEERVYAEAKDRPEVPYDSVPSLWPKLLALGVLILAMGALLGWMHVRTRGENKLWRMLYGVYNSGVGFFFGGAGLLLLFMWFGTGHDVTYRNENVFWTNPITFLIFPVGLLYAMGRMRGKAWLPKLWMACGVVALVGQALKLLPWFSQDTSLTVALCAPVVLGMALVSREVSRRLVAAA